MARIVVVDPNDEGTQALLTAGAAHHAATLGEAVAAVRSGDVAAVMLPRQVPGVGCCHTAAEVLASECAAAGLVCPTLLSATVEVLSTGGPAPSSQPPATTQESPDAGPVSGIDWATLTALEEDLGDPDFVSETVAIFLEELPGRTGAVADGIAAALPQDFGAAAHSLKSSSAMLGALLLADLCARLEQLAAAGDTAAAQELSQELLTEADVVAAALRDRAG